MPDEKEKNEMYDNETNKETETNNEDEKYIELYFESLGFERKE